MTETVDFALRTSDAAWIKRHNGTTDDKGRVHVQVPASQVEGVKLGVDMLRHRFADAPRDSDRVVLCPAKYVPDTAARYTFQAETGIPPQVAEWMRQQQARRG